MTPRAMLVTAAACCLLSACGSSAARVFAENPTLRVHTESYEQLRDLPPPQRKLFAGVYAFQDQTGQHKPNENYADYSFAVTQGGASILINAMKDAGQQQWFGVLERNRLGDLLQERQIIRANRSEHAGPDGRQLPPIGPLLNAGILLEGGIIGYDTNTLTGGLGATYLGIGASTQYRKDTVAIYLRAVSVLTSEVLVSLVTDKTIYSVSVQGILNRFVGFNKLLQAEAGLTTNEPVELAVKQAIEKAVYAVVIEGAARGYWSFQDKGKQQHLIDEYLAQRDGSAQLPASAESPPGGLQKATSGEDRGAGDTS